MFSFSLWTILRILYSLIFTIACAYISNFIKALEEKKKCPLSEGWRVSNSKFLASLLMVIGAVNVFIPASKFLSTLPIIGSSYVLIFVLMLFGLLFMINRISINILERDDSRCNVSGYETLIDTIGNRTLMECIYITIGVSILFFYL